MTISFILLASVTAAGAVAAILLRNLIHCVLALALCFIGLAGLFLQLNAQFAGLSQILVYVGAVAILMVFALMLTQGARRTQRALFSSSWRSGVLIACATFGMLAWTLHSGIRGVTGLLPATISVDDIGTALMGRFLIPLEIVGVLLTAAFIGAAVVAIDEKPEVS